MPVGKVRQYPYFLRLFHTSTPLRSVELSMKKESMDLVASTGHLWIILQVPPNNIKNTGLRKMGGLGKKTSEISANYQVCIQSDTSLRRIHILAILAIYDFYMRQTLALK